MSLILKPIPGLLPRWDNNPCGIPAPVGAWVMNEGSGGKVYDTSGNGNDGNIHGADWVAGNLNFVAANKDYVNVGSDLLVAPAAFTVIARVKPSSLTVDQRVVTRHGGGEDAQFTLWMDTGGAGDGWAWQVKDSTVGAITIGVNNVDATGNFQTVAGTCLAGGKTKIYVEGRETGSAAFPGQIHAGIIDIWIGAMDLASDQFFDGDIDYIYGFDCDLSASQIVYIHQHPYYAWEYPEIWELYAAAAGGISEVTKTDNLINFIDFGRLNLQKIQQDNLNSIIDSWKFELNKITIDKLLGDFKDSKIKTQSINIADILNSIKDRYTISQIKAIEDILLVLFDTAVKILDKKRIENLQDFSDTIKTVIAGIISKLLTDSLIINDLSKKQSEKRIEDVLFTLSDTEIKSLLRLGLITDNIINLSDNKLINLSRTVEDILLKLQEVFSKDQKQISEDKITMLSDDYISQVTGITRKLLQDSIILFDILNKKEEKRIIEELSILLDIVTKKEEKINVDTLSKFIDISTKQLIKLTSEELNFYEIYGKKLSKINSDSIVAISDTKYLSNIKTVGDILNNLTDILIKTLEKISVDDFIISDGYTADVIIITGIITKLLQDSLLINDIIGKKLSKIQIESLGISDTFITGIPTVAKLLLYLLTDIKDFSGKESNIKDFSGKESDIKGH